MRRGQPHVAELGPVAALVAEVAGPLVADRVRLGDRPRPEAGGLRPVSRPVRAGEHGLRNDRISDHRSVELAAGLQRVARPDPPLEVTVAKFTSGDAPVKLWKRNDGIATSKPTGRRRRSSCSSTPSAVLALPGAVVLRAALEDLHVVRADGEALELQRAEAPVDSLRSSGMRDSIC